MGNLILKCLVGGACAVVIATGGISALSHYEAKVTARAEAHATAEAAKMAREYKACGSAVLDDSGYSGVDPAKVSESTHIADLCAQKYPNLAEYGSALQSVQRKERIAKMQSASAD